MKVENIVLFKRFLKTEGANVLYAGMYKQAHAEDAPEDVEEFLRQVDAKGAILDAFRFPKIQLWSGLIIGLIKPSNGRKP